MRIQAQLKKRIVSAALALSMVISLIPGGLMPAARAASSLSIQTDGNFTVSFDLGQSVDGLGTYYFALVPNIGKTSGEILGSVLGTSSMRASQYTGYGKFSALMTGVDKATYGLTDTYDFSDGIFLTNAGDAYSLNTEKTVATFSGSISDSVSDLLNTYKDYYAGGGKVSTLESVPYIAILMTPNVEGGATFFSATDDFEAVVVLNPPNLYVEEDYEKRINIKGTGTGKNNEYPGDSGTMGIFKNTIGCDAAKFIAATLYLTTVKGNSFTSAKASVYPVSSGGTALTAGQSISAGLGTSYYVRVTPSANFTSANAPYTGYVRIEYYYQDIVNDRAYIDVPVSIIDTNGTNPYMLGGSAYIEGNKGSLASTTVNLSTSTGCTAPTVSVVGSKPMSFVSAVEVDASGNPVSDTYVGITGINVGDTIDGATEFQIQLTSLCDDSTKGLDVGSYSKYLKIDYKYGSTDLVLTIPVSIKVNTGIVTEKKVSYYDNLDGSGGTKIKDVTIAAGLKADGAPTGTHAKAGHTFQSWNTAANGSGTSYAANADLSGLTSDTNLYAQWQINTYTVTFDTDGGSTVASQTVNHGANATRPATDPTKAGSTFVNWVTASGGSTLFDFDTAITGNTTIYAKWTADAYTVTFDGNGGTLSKNSVGGLAYNDTVDPLPTGTRTGYTLNGFNTAQNGTGTDFTTATKVTGDITVYAQWTINKHSITFQAGTPAEATKAVTGMPSTLNNVDYDSTPAAASFGSPALAGYTFDGWKDGGGNTWTPGTTKMPDANVVLTAQWSAKNIALNSAPTYNATVGGGVVLRSGDADMTTTANGHTIAASNSEITYTINGEAVTVGTAKTYSNGVSITIDTNGKVNVSATGFSGGLETYTVVATSALNGSTDTKTLTVEPTKFNATVTVVKNAGGTPADGAGATVSIAASGGVDVSGITPTDNGDGTYSITGLPLLDGSNNPVTYTIGVTKTGWISGGSKTITSTSPTATFNFYEVTVNGDATVNTAYVSSSTTMGTLTSLVVQSGVDVFFEAAPKPPATGTASWTNATSTGTNTAKIEGVSAATAVTVSYSTYTVTVNTTVDGSAPTVSTWITGMKVLTGNAATNDPVTGTTADGGKSFTFSVTKAKYTHVQITTMTGTYIVALGTALESSHATETVAAYTVKAADPVTYWPTGSGYTTTKPAAAAAFTHTVPATGTVLAVVPAGETWTITGTYTPAAGYKAFTGTEGSFTVTGGSEPQDGKVTVSAASTVAANFEAIPIDLSDHTMNWVYGATSVKSGSTNTLAASGYTTGATYSITSTASVDGLTCSTTSSGFKVEGQPYHKPGTDVTFSVRATATNGTYKDATITVKIDRASPKIELKDKTTTSHYVDELTKDEVITEISGLLYVDGGWKTVDASGTDPKVVLTYSPTKLEKDTGDPTKTTGNTVTVSYTGISDITEYWDKDTSNSLVLTLAGSYDVKVYVTLDGDTGYWGFFDGDVKLTGTDKDSAAVSRSGSVSSGKAIFTGIPDSDASGYTVEITPSDTGLSKISTTVKVNGADAEARFRYYTLDVTSGGNGTVSVTGDTAAVVDTNKYAHGKQFNITATPATGYHFKQWNSGTGDVGTGWSAAASFTGYSLTSKTVKIAEFEANTVTIKIKKNNSDNDVARTVSLCDNSGAVQNDGDSNAMTNTGVTASTTFSKVPGDATYKIYVDGKYTKHTVTVSATGGVTFSDGDTLDYYTVSYGTAVKGDYTDGSGNVDNTKKPATTEVLWHGETADTKVSPLPTNLKSNDPNYTTLKWKQSDGANGSFDSAVPATTWSLGSSKPGGAVTLTPEYERSGYKLTINVKLDGTDHDSVLNGKTVYVTKKSGGTKTDTGVTVASGAAVISNLGTGSYEVEIDGKKVDATVSNDDDAVAVFQYWSWTLKENKPATATGTVTMPGTVTGKVFNGEGTGTFGDASLPGWKFKGWGADGQKSIASVTSKQELDAVWAENVITVTAYYNGATTSLPAELTSGKLTISDGTNSKTATMTSNVATFHEVVKGANDYAVYAGADTSKSTGVDVTATEGGTATGTLHYVDVTLDKGNPDHGTASITHGSDTYSEDNATHGFTILRERDSLEFGLSVAVDSNYKFSKWTATSGTGSFAGSDATTATNTYTLNSTVNEAVTITPSYERSGYTVTLTVLENGQAYNAYNGKAVTVKKGSDTAATGTISGNTATLSVPAGTGYTVEIADTADTMSLNVSAAMGTDTGDNTKVTFKYFTYHFDGNKPASAAASVNVDMSSSGPTSTTRIFQGNNAKAEVDYPTEPTLTGYTFKGWNTDEDDADGGTATWTENKADLALATAETVWYAVWEQNEPSYTASNLTGTVKVDVGTHAVCDIETSGAAGDKYDYGTISYKWGNNDDAAAKWGDVGLIVNRSDDGEITVTGIPAHSTVKTTGGNPEAITVSFDATSKTNGKTITVSFTVTINKGQMPTVKLTQVTPETSNGGKEGSYKIEQNSGTGGTDEGYKSTFTYMFKGPGESTYTQGAPGTGMGSLNTATGVVTGVGQGTYHVYIKGDDDYADGTAGAVTVEGPSKGFGRVTIKLDDGAYTGLTVRLADPTTGTALEHKGAGVYETATDGVTPDASGYDVYVVGATGTASPVNIGKLVVPLGDTGTLEAQFYTVTVTYDSTSATAASASHTVVLAGETTTLSATPKTGYTASTLAWTLDPNPAKDGNSNDIGAASSVGADKATLTVNGKVTAKASYTADGISLEALKFSTTYAADGWTKTRAASTYEGDMPTYTIKQPYGSTYAGDAVTKYGVTVEVAEEDGANYFKVTGKPNYVGKITFDVGVTSANGTHADNVIEVTVGQYDSTVSLSASGGTHVNGDAASTAVTPTVSGEYYDADPKDTYNGLNWKTFSASSSELNLTYSPNTLTTSTASVNLTVSLKTVPDNNQALAVVWDDVTASTGINMTGSYTVTVNLELDDDAWADYDGATVTVDTGKTGTISGKTASIENVPNGSYDVEIKKDGKTTLKKEGVTVNGATTVKFEYYTLDLTCGVNGTFDSALTTSAEAVTGNIYEKGTTFSVTAEPNTGYDFDAWTATTSGNNAATLLSGNTITDQSLTKRTVQTANFKAKTVSLTDWTVNLTFGVNYTASPVTPGSGELEYTGYDTTPGKGYKVNSTTSFGDGDTSSLTQGGLTLALDSGTWKITGTPDAATTYTFYVQAKAGNDETAMGTVTVNVAKAKIKNIDISKLPIPTPGTKDTTAVIPAKATVGYMDKTSTTDTEATVSWSGDKDGSGNFKYGVSYTASIELKPDGNHEFDTAANITTTLTQDDASNTNLSAGAATARDGANAVVTYIFPAAYKIVFNKNGGTDGASDTVPADITAIDGALIHAGDQVTLPATAKTFTKSGWTNQEKWAPRNNATDGTAFGSKYTVAAGDAADGVITMYLVWKSQDVDITPETYTAVYNMTQSDWEADTGKTYTTYMGRHYTWVAPTTPISVTGVTSNVSYEITTAGIKDILEITAGGVVQVKAGQKIPAVGTHTFTVKVTDNGKAGTPSNTADFTLVVKPIEIDKAAVYGIKAPAAGDATTKKAGVSKASTTVDFSSNYSVSSLTWADNDDSFKPGKTYTATVELTPSANYIFVAPEGTGYQAGETSAALETAATSGDGKWIYTVAADGSKLTLTKTFPETAITVAATLTATAYNELKVSGFKAASAEKASLYYVIYSEPQTFTSPADIKAAALSGTVNPTKLIARGSKADIDPSGSDVSWGSDFTLTSGGTGNANVTGGTVGTINGGTKYYLYVAAQTKTGSLAEDGNGGMATMEDEAHKPVASIDDTLKKLTVKINANFGEVTGADITVNDKDTSQIVNDLNSTGTYEFTASYNTTYYGLVNWTTDDAKTGSASGDVFTYTYATADAENAWVQANFHRKINGEFKIASTGTGTVKFSPDLSDNKLKIGGEVVQTSLPDAADYATTGITYKWEEKVGSGDWTQVQVGTGTDRDYETSSTAGKVFRLTISYVDPDYGGSPSTVFAVSDEQTQALSPVTPILERVEKDVASANVVADSVNTKEGGLYLKFPKAAEDVAGEDNPVKEYKVTLKNAATGAVVRTETITATGAASYNFRWNASIAATDSKPLTPDSNFTVEVQTITKGSNGWTNSGSGTATAASGFKTLTVADLTGTLTDKTFNGAPQNGGTLTAPVGAGTSDDRKVTTTYTTDAAGLNDEAAEQTHVNITSGAAGPYYVFVQVNKGSLYLALDRTSYTTKSTWTISQATPTLSITSPLSGYDNVAVNLGTSNPKVTYTAPGPDCHGSPVGTVTNYYDFTYAKKTWPAGDSSTTISGSSMTPKAKGAYVITVSAAYKSTDSDQYKADIGLPAAKELTVNVALATLNSITLNNTKRTAVYRNAASDKEYNGTTEVTPTADFYKTGSAAEAKDMLTEGLTVTIDWGNGKAAQTMTLAQFKAAGGTVTADKETLAADYSKVTFSKANTVELTFTYKNMDNSVTKTAKATFVLDKANIPYGTGNAEKIWDGTKSITGATWDTDDSYKVRGGSDKVYLIDPDVNIYDADAVNIVPPADSQITFSNSDAGNNWKMQTANPTLSGGQAGFYALDHENYHQGTGVIKPREISKVLVTTDTPEPGKPIPTTATATVKDDLGKDGGNVVTPIKWQRWDDNTDAWEDVNTATEPNFLANKKYRPVVTVQADNNHVLKTLPTLIPGTDRYDINGAQNGATDPEVTNPDSTKNKVAINIAGNRKSGEFIGLLFDLVVNPVLKFEDKNLAEGMSADKRPADANVYRVVSVVKDTDLTGYMYEIDLGNYELPIVNVNIAKPSGDLIGKGAKVYMSDDASKTHVTDSKNPQQTSPVTVELADGTNYTSTNIMKVGDKLSTPTVNASTYVVDLSGVDTSKPGYYSVTLKAVGDKSTAVDGSVTAQYTLILVVSEKGAFMEPNPELKFSDVNVNDSTDKREPAAAVVRVVTLDQGEKGDRYTIDLHNFTNTAYDVKVNAPEGDLLTRNVSITPNTVQNVGDMDVGTKLSTMAGKSAYTLDLSKVNSDTAGTYSMTIKAVGKAKDGSDDILVEATYQIVLVVKEKTPAPVAGPELKFSDVKEGAPTDVEGPAGTVVRVVQTPKKSGTTNLGKYIIDLGDYRAKAFDVKTTVPSGNLLTKGAKIAPMTVQSAPEMNVGDKFSTIAGPSTYVLDLTRIDASVSGTYKVIITASGAGEDNGAVMTEASYTFMLVVKDKDIEYQPVGTPVTVPVEVVLPVVKYWISDYGLTNDLTAEKMMKKGDKPSFTPKVEGIDGYTFLGWSETDPAELKEGEEIKLVDPKTFSINEDKIFYAVYREPEPIPELTVEFRLMEHGKSDDELTQTVLSGDHVAFVPEVEPAPRYEFLGWSETDPQELPEGEEPKIVNPVSYVITENKVFYAVYGEADFDHTHYMVGFPDGTFRPDQPITRAEVAAIIARACLDGFVDGSGYGDGGYSDVKLKKWYADEVAFCSEAGVFVGYKDGTFKPEQPITREELASVVARLAGIQKNEGVPFTDADKISKWARDSVYTVYTNGWVAGYRDGTFKPKENITRAETVRIFNGYLNRGVNAAGLEGLTPYLLDSAAGGYEGDGTTEYLTWTDVPKKYWAYYDIIEASNDHNFHWPEEENALPEDWDEVFLDEQWRYRPEYDVTFDLGIHGTSATTLVQRVKINGKCKYLPVVKAEEGYTFVGWSESPDGAIVDPLTTPITGEKTYYAVYELVWREAYIVRYVAGTSGALTGAAVEAVLEGDTPLAVPGVRPVEGYTFLGWSEEPGGELLRPTEVKITEDKTFYAVYKKND